MNRRRVLWLVPLALLLCAFARPSSARAADDLQVLEEQAMKAAVARVAPAVVRIETIGGLERIGQVLVGTGPTTGLVVASDGYVISSAFNFAQKPASILVTFPDGARRAARLVATDHNRMLVLLKVDPPAGLAVPEAVPQSALQTGQWSIAVGRTFDLAKPNVSVGVISALERIYGKAIQTDAKVSPSNYGGPLVDISGRVLGVLVPLAPEGPSETAGVEWYDSGIGFAVPLEHILAVLPRLKEGKDLLPGVVGVNLASADLFTQPPVIAAVRAGSPAAKAGFQAGDKIVEAAGKPVRRQADLKHQLASRYAGDKLTLVVSRGSERISREIELVDKLPPYEFPFLGILPMRAVGNDALPLTVRFVYPAGPASKADVRLGDVIASIDGKPVADRKAAAERLRSLAPGQAIKLALRRGEEKLEAAVTLDRLPEAVPPELPPAYAEAKPAEAKPAEGEKPQVGMIDVKIPEFANACYALVPSNYDPRIACGVLIYLAPPGELSKDDLAELWRPLGESARLIVLAPRPADAAKWQPTEARYVRRTLEELRKSYAIDPTRVVLYGHEAGGIMAFLTALSNADVVRGVAVNQAPLPLSIRPPETDPVRPMAFFLTQTDLGDASLATAAGINRLRELKYPVTELSLGAQPRTLKAADLAELVHWIDALDRL